MTVRTLLIANRGEIARRIIRTARAMGIATVAVYAEPDAHSLHVAEADMAVALGGRTPAESYLDVARLIEAAKRTGADAVHPGYGFVSERADAARAVVDAGLVWVGPAPDVIAALGDKIRAKELMGAAGVPLLPSVALTADAPGGSWIELAAGVGYPLLVKAAAGGGGRGMRLVESAADLEQAVRAATREAVAAFGDGTVFLERWLASPRHVEVQIVADAAGHVVHLGERECSIQRRHQKVVEEAPSVSISAEVRAGLTGAAVAGAIAVGYEGVGTWEFLVDGDGYYFLEVNTRLQVEHPVTEEVTGLDLVELQLRVASGAGLGISQGDIGVTGHAIEVRVVAEDPALGWLPSAGTLHRFDAGRGAGRPGVRYELGFGSGSTIPADYDSLLGKVIAAGATRAVAAARLAAALEDLEVHGPATNRRLLIALLREEGFLAGETTTGYLEAHPELAAAGSSRAPDAHAIAAALWLAHQRRAEAPVLRTLPSGWRNIGADPQRVAWAGDAAGDEPLEVSYAMGRDGTTFEAAVGDRPAAGCIRGASASGIDVEIGGILHRCRCERAGDSVWVASGLGQTTLVERPRFPDPDRTAGAGRGPTAPVPGTVIAIEVTAGQSVTAGQTLVVLEAMKLEHRIQAAADGVVISVDVTVGERVDASQVLVTVHGTEPPPHGTEPPPHGTEPPPHGTEPPPHGSAAR
ncbi:MAG: biotin carboxylase N-terminal domain-containing protein [Acidimicrobiales bacterium]